ncbi:MAG: hypothetical protein ABIR96_00790 [Bdellovibrionota bacterium]
MKFSDFKALVPRWIFFDGFGAACRVELRFGETREELGPWIEAFTPVERTAWQLFHNPRGNLRLFAISSFERFIVEAQQYLEDPDVFAKSETYAVCMALLKEHVTFPHSGFFQFKVQAVLENEDMAGLQDAFVSSVQAT